MPIPACDYRYEPFDMGVEVADDFLDFYTEECLPEGYRIGGYPIFIQEDPRKRRDSKDFLLLQLDSDDGIMWGDAGIVNFFIR